MTRKKPTRFDIAKKNIVSFFRQQETNIFSFTQIAEILESQRTTWNLPSRFSVKAFIELLLSKTDLKMYEFKFPAFEIFRFSWGEASIIDLTSTLKENAYFSHYSAMFLHGLTEQIPKTLYLNTEQSQKPIPKGELKQQNIDRAFSNAQRTSQNTATLSDNKICLLNGKFTNRLGVVTIEGKNKRQLFVTDVERTLIDITVRPSYAGGVFEVLKAFHKAKDKVSINKLTALLKKLDYIYPYHQAIGYYLEKTGDYSQNQIKLLERFEINYNFYLTHQMKEKDYSPKWKLYYPKGF
jgi:predicted transcriptional regulator of viral defense system